MDAFFLRLPADGWQVTGISRSTGALQQEHYAHFARDVTTAGYRELLREQSAEPFDAVIYCAGIAEPLVLGELEREVRVLEVNLVAAVSTAAVVLPAMLAPKARQLRRHFEPRGHARLECIPELQRIQCQRLVVFRGAR